jgi:FixJ family two-component response regulator
MVTAEAPVICVIDDDPSIREALMGLLRSADLRVEAFASAEAFLSHAPPPSASAVSFLMSRCRG